MIKCNLKKNRNWEKKEKEKKQEKDETILVYIYKIFLSSSKGLLA